MKKILVVFVMIVLSGCTSKGCDPMDEQICFDSESEHFLFETDAKILVDVPNEAYGEALEALWNEVYPNNVGLLNTIVAGEQSFDALETSEIDLLYLDAHRAILLKDHLINVDEELVVRIKPHLAPNFILDETDLFFIPMSAYGVVFATNLDYLSAHNLSVIDANQDGLVDAFDSFEEIAEAHLSVPFDFKDPLFTQGFSTLNYSLFENYKEEAFSHQSFLSALESLKRLGQLYDATKWTYEEFLNDPQQAFSMIGTWMYWEDATSNNLYAKLPSFEDHHFKSIAYPQGYVLHKSTRYPNAAHEVLAFIRSERGLQLFSDHSGQLLVYPSALEVGEEQMDKPYTLKYKNEMQRMIAEALLETQVENYEGLASNPNYRYYDSLKVIDYQTVIAQVFNQEMSPEEAQSLLDQRFKEWLDSFKEEE